MDQIVEQVQRWGSAVVEVEGGYRGTIDDYTNDLALRDLIESRLEQSGPETRRETRRHLEELDRRFRTATRLDAEGRLGRFFAVGPGWWWQRIPKKLGSLSAYLPTKANPRHPGG